MSSFGFTSSAGVVFPAISDFNISFSMLRKEPSLTNDFESRVTPKRLFICMANLIAEMEVNPA